MLVIHWLTNPEASYLLTVLVQCSHHLVVLPYLKFHLRYAVTTTLVQTTTHQLGTTHQAQWNVAPPCFYQGFPGSWPFFLYGCGVSHCGSKHSSHPTVCLNHTVFSKYMISKELNLNLSKYVDKLLVVKTLINIRHFS